MFTRTLQDRYGVVWLVWQALPGQQPGTRGGKGTPVPEEKAEGCLTFESESEKRRVRPIPPRWMEYSDDELRAMCRMAVPVLAGQAERRPVTKPVTSTPTSIPSAPRPEER